MSLARSREETGMAQARVREGGVLVTRRMKHDLMNHLCVALGNSELLAGQLTPEDPSHAPLLDILEACNQAVALVSAWGAPGTDRPSRRT